MSWYSLLSALAPEPQPPLQACPDCGEPLVTGADGVLFCRFDGWRDTSGRRSSTPGS